MVIEQLIPAMSEDVLVTRRIYRYHATGAVERSACNGYQEVRETDPQGIQLQTSGVLIV